jgi:hypothetical protein
MPDLLGERRSLRTPGRRASDRADEERKVAANFLRTSNANKTAFPQDKKHTWCVVSFPHGHRMTVDLSWWPDRRTARTERRKQLALFPEGCHIVGRFYVGL